MTYRLHAVFSSLQGEGRHSGRPATFVRFSSCNLACAWCDTRRSTRLVVPLDELVRKVKHRANRYVILTGGEPSVQPYLSELVRALKDAGFTVALETNGLIAPPEPALFDYIACSPKPDYLTRYQDAEMLHKADEVRIVAQSPLIASACRQFRARIAATDYYISPLESHGRIHYQRALDLINKLNNLESDAWPPWSLSIQTHKVLGIR